MTVVLVFVAAVVTVAVLWLLREGVTSKPWLETGLAGGPSAPVEAGPAGLTVFLVVVGALFALFGSAFVMRMDLEPWAAFSLPAIAWANTLWLVLASILLHLAARAERDGDGPDLRIDAALAGLATLAFLAGQIEAWRAVAQAGGGLTGGPGAAFFYVLSGLHGLHILGGLAALAAIAARGAAWKRPAGGIALCARYWDFLLVVWLGLLVLFLGWANRLVDICRTVLT